MGVTRIATDFGAYQMAGPARLDFVCPATAVKGDLLVAVLAGEGAAPSPTTGPTGWTRYVDESASGGASRHAEVWAKIADGTEAGATLSFPSGGSLLGGVLVVYRGAQVVPPQAADVDSVTCQRSVGVTNHTTVASEGSQSEDRRILLWWVQNVGVTITEAVNALFSSFGKELDANTGWVTAGEYLANAAGTSGALTCTSSAVANGVEVAVTIRTRQIARPVGASDPTPGTIGLTV